MRVLVAVKVDAEEMMLQNITLEQCTLQYKL
jgi:hypothetical protein